jgi:hypothetical protein
MLDVIIRSFPIERGSVMIFLLVFFHESFSPEVPVISNFSDIRKSRCTIGVNDTSCKLTIGVVDTGGHIFPEI